MEGISTTTSLDLQLHVQCFYLWDEERDEPYGDVLTSDDHAAFSTVTRGHHRAPCLLVSCRRSD
jgi:hypothetical protein